MTHHLPGLHFDDDHPQICVPLYSETIEDLSQSVRSLAQLPADVVEFRAASFNGISNVSQIGNALLMITSPLSAQPVIFSCHMQELPEYCRSEEEYKNILTFAVRTGLIDAVEIESTLPEEDIEELSDLAFEAGIIPILTIRCKAPFSETAFAEQLFSVVSEDIAVYHIICHLETKEEAAEYLEVIHACTAAHEDAHFIIELTGQGGKELLKSKISFTSPLLYAAETETADCLSVSDLHQILSSTIDPSAK